MLVAVNRKGLQLNTIPRLQNVFISISSHTIWRHVFVIWVRKLLNWVNRLNGHWFDLGTSSPGYELSWVRVVLGTSCHVYELIWILVRIVSRTTRIQDNSYPRRLSRLGYGLSLVRIVLGTICLGYELSRSHSMYRHMYTWDIDFLSLCVTYIAWRIILSSPSACQIGFR